MGACLDVFHVSVFMPVDVMQIYCSLSSVMHSAHCKHKFYKFYSTYPLEQKTTVEKSVLRIAASLMREAELDSGRCLWKTKLIFTKLSGSFVASFARTPPNRKQNKNLIISIDTRISQINAVDML